MQLSEGTLDYEPVPHARVAPDPDAIKKEARMLLAWRRRSNQDRQRHDRCAPTIIAQAKMGGGQ